MLSLRAGSIIAAHSHTDTTSIIQLLSLCMYARNWTSYLPSQLTMRLQGNQRVAFLLHIIFLIPGLNDTFVTQAWVWTLLSPYNFLLLDFGWPAFIPHIAGSFYTFLCADCHSCKIGWSRHRRITRWDSLYRMVLQVSIGCRIMPLEDWEQMFLDLNACFPEFLNHILKRPFFFAIYCRGARYPILTQIWQWSS